MTHQMSCALSSACRALWLATLSLMTAFMHQRAPAHRCLLARRIASNLQTLSSQDCFDPASRASFTRLAQRWKTRADALAIAQTDTRAGPDVRARLTWP